jgi:hypothetical protein
MKDGDDVGKHNETNEGHKTCTRQKKGRSAEVIPYSV